MKRAALPAALALALAGAAHAQAEAAETGAAPLNTPAQALTQFCETLGERGFNTAIYGLLMPELGEMLLSNDIYSEEFKQTLSAMDTVTSYNSCEVLGAQGDTVRLRSTVLDLNALPDEAFGKQFLQESDADSDAQGEDDWELPSSAAMNEYFAPLVEYLAAQETIPTLTYEFEVPMQQRGDLWMPTEEGFGTLFDYALTGEDEDLDALESALE